LALLSTGTTADYFHAAGKYCCDRLKLNICLRIGIEIPERHFMIKPGVSSNLNLLMALQTSELEIGAIIIIIIKLCLSL
jgi:hypothetical protein